MYICVVYLGPDRIDIDIYDEEGKLVRHEKVGPNVKSIEVSGRYFRLSRSELSNEVTVVCSIDSGIVRAFEKIVHVS